jgi:spore coat polysaccharide biosynthesis predicted glycosyltransferase SpsG
MYKEIGSVKFGICSGGITTYEFAAKKIPFAIICDEKHQLLTAKIWHKKKIAKNFGIVDKNTPKKISKLLLNFEEIRKELEVGNFVDGKGSKRIRDEILKMF